MNLSFITFIFFLRNASAFCSPSYFDEEGFRPQESYRLVRENILRMLALPEHFIYCHWQIPVMFCSLITSVGTAEHFSPSSIKENYSDASCCWSNQKIPHLLWNPKVQYHVCLHWSVLSLPTNDKMLTKGLQSYLASTWTRTRPLQQESQSP